MDAKTWDIQTVTTADFAVKIPIPEKVWERWNYSYERVKTQMTFKDYLIYELELQVNQLSN